MKRSAFAALMVAAICPVAAAAVVPAGDTKACQQFGSRPVLTESNLPPAAETPMHAAPLHVDWIVNTPSTAKWSWVRPQTAPSSRLPSTLVSVPAPGAVALVGLAGLLVSRRRA